MSTASSFLRSKLNNASDFEFGKSNYRMKQYAQTTTFRVWSAVAEIINIIVTPLIFFIVL